MLEHYITNSILLSFQPLFSMIILNILRFLLMRCNLLYRRYRYLKDISKDEHLPIQLHWEYMPNYEKE